MIRVARQLDPVPARCLGHIEGLVGTPDEPVQGLMALTHGHSHTRRDGEDKPVANLEAVALDGRAQPLSMLRRAEGGGTHQEQDELLAPVAYRDVCVAHVIPQDLRHLTQHLVARPVTVAVIHLFEATEVDHGRGNRGRGVSVVDAAVAPHGVLHVDTVEEPGE